MADTPNGETATPGDTQTTVTTTANPPADNGSAAEVERLRKEKEHSELRIRQLENEAAARNKAEEEAQQKQLEEDNQYKSLYEQEKAKREAAESDSERREREAELFKAKQTALKDYPEEVQQQAEDLGIDLADAEQVDAYKAKLDKLNSTFETAGKITPNNGRTNNQTRGRKEIMQDYANGNDNAFDEALSSIPFISENTKS